MGFAAASARIYDVHWISVWMIGCDGRLIWRWEVGLVAHALANRFTGYLGGTLHWVGW